jgi:hypothetical protein
MGLAGLRHVSMLDTRHRCLTAKPRTADAGRGGELRGAPHHPSARHARRLQDTSCTAETQLAHQLALQQAQQHAQRVAGALRATPPGWQRVEAAAQQLLRLQGALTSRLALLESLAHTRERLLHAIAEAQHRLQQPGSSRQLSALELHLLAHPAALQAHQAAMDAAAGRLQRQVDCIGHAQVFFAWLGSVAEEDARQRRGGSPGRGPSGTHPAAGASAGPNNQLSPDGHSRGRSGLSSSSSCSRQSNPAGSAGGERRPAEVLAGEVAHLLPQLPGSCEPLAPRLVSKLARQLSHAAASTSCGGQPAAGRDAAPAGAEGLAAFQAAAAEALLGARLPRAQPELDALPDDLAVRQEQRQKAQQQQQAWDGLAAAPAQWHAWARVWRPPRPARGAAGSGAPGAGGGQVAADTRRLQSLSLAVARQLARVRAAMKQQLAAGAGVFLPASGAQQGGGL